MNSLLLLTQPELDKYAEWCRKTAKKAYKRMTSHGSRKRRDKALEQFNVAVIEIAYAEALSAELEKRHPEGATAGRIPGRDRIALWEGAHHRAAKTLEAIADDMDARARHAAEQVAS